MKGRWIRPLAQVLVSLGLLGLVLFLIDEQALLARLARLDPTWVGIGLLISVPQYIFSALRWRLTAEKMGAHLPFRVALAEYYVAVFANQLLPGGVLGDAARAFRHGRRLRATHEAPQGVAFRAVIYERASGQVVLMALLVPGLAFWPLVFGGTSTRFMALIATVAGIVTLSVLLWFLFRRSRWSKTFFSEIRSAIFARDVVGLQILYSCLVLVTYVLCFACGARAVGVNLSLGEIVTLVPIVLFSMTIPISVSGWGVREAAAASVWGLAHLPAADGVASSVAYGVIVLLSSVPGIFFLATDASATSVKTGR